MAPAGASLSRPSSATLGDGIRAVMALDTDGHRFVTEEWVIRSV